MLSIKKKFGSEGGPGPPSHTRGAATKRKKERKKWVKNNYQQKMLNAQSHTLCMSEHQNQNRKKRRRR